MGCSASLGCSLILGLLFAPWLFAPWEPPCFLAALAACAAPCSVGCNLLLGAPGSSGCSLNLGLLIDSWAAPWSLGCSLFLGNHRYIRRNGRIGRRARTDCGWMDHHQNRSHSDRILAQGRGTDLGSALQDSNPKSHRSHRSSRLRTSTRAGSRRPRTHHPPHPRRDESRHGRTWGGRCRTRTCDFCLVRAALWPTELNARTQCRTGALSLAGGRVPESGRINRSFLRKWRSSR